jgi:formylglycine-generating enzyme required for sulfatase activity
MVSIPAGSYQPLYSDHNASIRVPAFRLDRYPVSRADFEKFMARTNVKAAVPTSADARIVATKVTRAAARAYCRAQGKRLPNVNEWEYVAAASTTLRDASGDPGFRQQLLDLYTRKRSALAPVIGTGFTNAYGVGDMHGVVWEWTEDAPAAHAVHLAANHKKHDLTCAGSTNGASDARNFAAFLRYAYRSGLNDRSSGDNLGFRCAD